MNNLSDYFENEQEFYLDSITYSRIEHNTNKTEVKLICNDTIQANRSGDENVIVTVKRDIRFDPEILFKLSISYGVILHLIPEKKGEISWDELDLSVEFRDNGSFATANVFNKISLLIGEITGSFGQSPMIIPPQYMKVN